MYQHEGNHQLATLQPQLEANNSHNDRHERMRQLANVCIEMFVSSNSGVKSDTPTAMAEAA
jgi:hypothetical protein